MTDFGEGPVSFRFQEDTLVKMWGRCGFSTVERVGPELLGIWNRPVASGETRTVISQLSTVIS